MSNQQPPNSADGPNDAADQPPQPRYGPPPQYGPPLGQPPQTPPPPPQYAPQYAPQPPRYGPQPPQYAPQPNYPPPPGSPDVQLQTGGPRYAATYAATPGPGGPFDGAVHPGDMSRPLYGASFGQAMKRLFRGYVKFSGRASRSEYWWAVLFMFLLQLVPNAMIIAGVFSGIFSSATDPNAYDPDAEVPIGGISLVLVGTVLSAIVGLALLLPSFSLGWRRFHDGNFPGPLYLLALGGIIPYLNFVTWIAVVAVIVFAIMPSKVEGRRFDDQNRRQYAPPPQGAF